MASSHARNAAAWSYSGWNADERMLDSGTAMWYICVASASSHSSSYACISAGEGLWQYFPGSRPVYRRLVLGSGGA